MQIYSNELYLQMCEQIQCSPVLIICHIYVTRNSLCYDKRTISKPLLQKYSCTHQCSLPPGFNRTSMQNVKLTDCITKPQHKHNHGISCFSCTSADCSTMTQLVPRSQMTEAEEQLIVVFMTLFCSSAAGSSLRVLLRVYVSTSSRPHRQYEALQQSSW